jgi:hypothetical protein
MMTATIASTITSSSRVVPDAERISVLQAGTTARLAGNGPNRPRENLSFVVRFAREGMIRQAGSFV